MEPFTAFIVYDIFHTTEHPIILDLSIGNGQNGSSKLELGTKEIGDFKNTFKKEIGTSSDLKGKSLSITTNIQDIQPNTNRINLDIKLTGGRETKEQSIINTTVPNSGDTVRAIITIRFV